MKKLIIIFVFFGTNFFAIAVDLSMQLANMNQSLRHLERSLSGSKDTQSKPIKIDNKVFDATIKRFGAVIDTFQIELNNVQKSGKKVVGKLDSFLKKDWDKIAKQQAAFPEKEFEELGLLFEQMDSFDEKQLEYAENLLQELGSNTYAISDLSLEQKGKSKALLEKVTLLGNNVVTFSNIILKEIESKLKAASKRTVFNEIDIAEEQETNEVLLSFTKYTPMSDIIAELLSDVSEWRKEANQIEKIVREKVQPLINKLK